MRPRARFEHRLERGAGCRRPSVPPSVGSRNSPRQAERLGLPPPWEAGAVLDVADGDGGCVAAGFLGGGGEVSERGVADVVGVEVQGGRVVGFEAFEEVL